MSTNDRNGLNGYQIEALKGVALLSGILAFAASAAATESFAANDSWKRAWLTDVGLSIKESYDDNVYMSGMNQSLVPTGAMTLKDQGSFITTVSPKVELNFARCLGSTAGVDVLSFSYVPEFAMYHNLPEENYDAHRFLLGVKGETGPLSYNLDNNFVYVDGSKIGPLYPGNLLNAWSTIFDWARRDQINDKLKNSLQYDWNDWFLRGSASLAYYGMMTELKNVEGYQNYPTRYDVNGGADIGYRFNTNMAATLDYRYGSQYQQQFSFSPYSSSSDYQRVLAGLEGKPAHWLDVQLLGGPDFRSYQPDTASHITPVDNLHTTTYYAEAAIAARITTNDNLTFKFKQYQFVSSCGKVPYFDSRYGLAYSHQITSQLSLNMGAQLLEADYNSGNISNSKRNDLDYIISIGLHYVITKNFAADLSYSDNIGRNDEDGIANSETRDFNAQDVSLGIQCQF